jgi:hypothetical protein
VTTDHTLSLMLQGQTITCPVQEIILRLSALPSNEDFGPFLRNMGFFKITQLSHKYIELSELSRWLGINEGTAVLIFQYVDEDTEKFRVAGLV